MPVLGRPRRPDCIVLERKRTEFDWGASGIGEVILLGVATNVFTSAVTYVSAKLLDRRQPTAEPMGESEAIQWARQKIAGRYDEEAEMLEVVHVANSTSSVDVELRHASGRPTYRVEVQGRGAQAVAVVIERRP